VTIAIVSANRFPTTDGPSGTNSVDTTTGDRTFDCTGNANAKAAVLVLHCTGTTSVVTGVLYGGIAMRLETFATDTSEAGRVEVWVLDDQESFPTGTQTVTLQGCTATAKWATCVTMTCSAAPRAKVNASNFKNTTTATNPTLTVVTTETTILVGGMHGGAASPASYVVGSGHTSLYNNDYGALVARSSRRSAEVAAGSIVFDYTYATSDDYCIAAVALQEYTPPAGPAVVPTESVYNTATTPKSVVVAGCLEDDYILIVAGGNDNADVSAIAASTTAGSTGSWTDPVEEGFGASSSWVSSALAQVTADGSVTVQIAATGAIEIWGMCAFRIRGSGGLGAHGKVGSSAVDVVNLAGVAQDSAVFYISTDWNAGTVGTSWTPTDAILVERAVEGAGDFTLHIAYWLGEDAGTRDYGSVGAGGSAVRAIAIEMLNVSSVPTLVVQNLQQAQVYQSVTLSPTLVVNNLQQAQVITPPTLSPVLIVQNLQQSQATTSPTLVVSLVVQNLQQSQVITPPILSPTLVVQNLQQSQVLTSPLVALPGADLVVQNLQQNQVETSPLLVVDLVVQNLQQSQVISPLTLVTNLVVQNLQQSQAITSPTLVVTLVVQNLQQSQVITPPTLVTDLVVQNLQQSQAITSPTLVVDLVVQNLQQIQIYQPLTLTAGGIDLVVQSINQVQALQAVTLSPTLIVNNLAQVQALQTILLSLVLQVQNLQQSQTYSPITLAPTLQVQNLQQSQTYSPITLIPTLQVNSLAQLQSLTSLALSVTLAIQNLNQSQVLSSVTFEAGPGEFTGWGIALV
jgi:hypothetical protein